MDILDSSYEEICEMPLERIIKLGIPKKVTRKILSNPDVNKKLELYWIRIAFPADLAQITSKDLQRELVVKFDELLRSNGHIEIKKRYGLLIGKIKAMDKAQK